MMIHPTHRCFDDALDLLWALLHEPAAQDARLFLVHGLCLAPDGLPYAHAWLEDDADATVLSVGVIDGKTTAYSLPRTTYYAQTQVQERTRYPAQEALAANRATGHYGPWEARYVALCTPRRQEP